MDIEICPSANKTRASTAFLNRAVNRSKETKGKNVAEKKSAEAARLCAGRFLSSREKELSGLRSSARHSRKATRTVASNSKRLEIKPQSKH